VLGVVLHFFIALYLFLSTVKGRVLFCQPSLIFLIVFFGVLDASLVLVTTVCCSSEHPLFEHLMLSAALLAALSVHFIIVCPYLF